MILSVIALSAALLAPQQQAKNTTTDAAPVTLSRLFAKGEKLQYSVLSNLHVESRQYGLQTFMPEELDLDYKFTTEVKELKNDGVAVVHYLRPNMVQVDGETADRGPKTTVEKVDWNFDLTVSPINEVVEMKDLNPPKKKPTPKPSGGDDGGDGGQFILMAGAGARQQPLFIGQFISEMYRLALNVGSMDSALDFSPKLPLDEVKVGDTWKKTVSYEPQKLKGKDGKQAVQRLDYTFTYKGLVTVNGKQFYRINAALDLNSDLGDYINQLIGMKPAESHLKSIPLKLKQSIDYDLDMATKRTVLARSKADGGFTINVTDVDEPVQEQKMSGSTEMKLVAIGVATPVKTPAKAASAKGGGHRR
jgi:hypothetical protein